MRVALLTDESLPMGTRVHAKMIHELAVEFQRNGHKCVVITPGDPKQKSKLVIDYLDGVEIWRFRSGYIRGYGMVRRVFNEWLLSFRAWRAIAKEVERCGFDLCINYTPSIFFGPLARRLKVRGTYVYLILRDMFPQWLIDQGIISKRSPARIFLEYYEKLNYRMSDCIGVMSEANMRVFREAHPSYANVKILMNWSSTSSSFLDNETSNIRRDYDLSEKVVFFYGGNLGHSNDMHNIMRLARNLIDHTDAHFLIIGQGDYFDWIKEVVVLWELRNVTVLPSVPQDEFKKILKEVDVGLFSLSKKHTAHNFPGKLLGYMVESIPILGSTNHGNDLLDLVNSAGAGYIHVNGNDDALAVSAVKLLKNKTVRLDCGTNSRALLMKRFSVESAFAKITSELDVVD